MPSSTLLERLARLNPAVYKGEPGDSYYECFFCGTRAVDAQELQRTTGHRQWCLWVELREVTHA